MRAVTLGVFQRLTQVLFFRFSLFWAVTQRTSVVIYRRRGRAYWSHFQRSSSQRTGGTETSVRNYHYLSRNNREEQRAHPHRGWSLISVLVPFVPQCSVPISHSIPEGQHLVCKMKADSNPVSSVSAKGTCFAKGGCLNSFYFLMTFLPLTGFSPNQNSKSHHHKPHQLIKLSCRSYSYSTCHDTHEVQDGSKIRIIYIYLRRLFSVEARISVAL